MPGRSRAAVSQRRSRRETELGRLGPVNPLPLDGRLAPGTAIPASSAARNARSPRENAAAFPTALPAFARPLPAFAPPLPEAGHLSTRFPQTLPPCLKTRTRIRKIGTRFGQTGTCFGQILPRRPADVPVSRKQVLTRRSCSRFSPKTFPDFTSTKPPPRTLHHD